MSAATVGERVMWSFPPVCSPRPSLSPHPSAILARVLRSISFIDFPAFTYELIRGKNSPSNILLHVRSASLSFHMPRRVLAILTVLTLASSACKPTPVILLAGANGGEGSISAIDSRSGSQMRCVRCPLPGNICHAAIHKSYIAVATMNLDGESKLYIQTRSGNRFVVPLSSNHVVASRCDSNERMVALAYQGVLMVDPQTGSTTKILEDRSKIDAVFLTDASLFVYTDRLERFSLGDWKPTGEWPATVRAVEPHRLIVSIGPDLFSIDDTDQVKLQSLSYQNLLNDAWITVVDDRFIVISSDYPSQTRIYDLNGNHLKTYKSNVLFNAFPYQDPVDLDDFSKLQP